MAHYKIGQTVSLLLMMSIANVASASSVEKLSADARFDRRGESVEDIHKAKETYLKIIKSKKESLELRREALDRYGRLTVFEGEVAKERFQPKKLSDMFKTCIEVTDLLSPKKIDGDMVPEHAYWRAMCIGLWAANASMGDIVLHMGRISEMQTLINIGMRRFPTFDGYGFNRMLAGIYVRSGEGFASRQYFKPAEALELITVATLHGTDNYMDYILQAEALVALKRKEEAKTCLIEAIAELKSRFEARDIPAMLLAENQIFLKKMCELLAELS